MNNQISRLIIDTCGRIVYLTVIFFGFTFWLYSYNSIDQPLKESWSLSINFFSAIGTISAVLVAIYAFYFQAVQNQPNLEFQITGIESTDDNEFLKVRIHKVYIMMNNLGGKALKFIPKIKHKGDLKENKYSLSPPYGYDIIKNLEFCENGYRIIITVHGDLNTDIHDLFKELKFEISFNFIDTAQKPHCKKFNIVSKQNKVKQKFLYLV